MMFFGSMRVQVSPRSVVGRDVNYLLIGFHAPRPGILKNWN